MTVGTSAGSLRSRRVQTTPRTATVWRSSTVAVGDRSDPPGSRMGRATSRRRGRRSGRWARPPACAASTAGGARCSCLPTARPGPTAFATSVPTSPSATGSCRRLTANASSTCSSAARRSCAGHRSKGARAVAHTLAANIDVVFLCHSFAVAPNQRRLERELVLAFDSGADPMVLLTKSDLVDDPEPARRELQEVALGVPVLVSSGRTRRRARRAARHARAGTDGGVLGGQRCRQVDARQRPARRAAPGDDRGSQRSPRPPHHRRRRATAASPRTAAG